MFRARGPIARMYIDKFLKTHRTPVLDAEDVAAIDASAARTTTFNARQIFIRQHTPLSQCTLLLDGFVERFKDTPDGRRQILAIHVPGDFVDLHSYPLKRLEHSVAALTDIKVALFPHAGIRELTARSATIIRVPGWRVTPSPGDLVHVTTGENAGTYIIGAKPMRDGKGVWDCPAEITP